MAAGAGASGGCSVAPETCNGRDDDCDRRIDEETEAQCAKAVVNARTACVPAGDGAQCALIDCHEGFANCNADPADGCECRSPSSTADSGLPDAGDTADGACPGAGSEADCGGACRASLLGVYAFKTELDVWWQEDAHPSAPMYDPGRGPITVLYKAVISSAFGMEATAVLRVCGLQLPPLVSNLRCEAFQLAVSDRAWDQPSMPLFSSSVSLTGFDPGDSLSLDQTYALLGISLDDPSAMWPSAEEVGGLVCPEGVAAACFPDVDGDLREGLEVSTVKIGEHLRSDSCGLASQPVVYQGLPLPGGLSAVDVRAVHLHAGLRIAVAGAGRLDASCQGAAADAQASSIDLRVWDCSLSDGLQCAGSEIAFVDSIVPSYRLLSRGEAPPADVLRSACECDGGCGGTRCPLDQSPSTGPRSTFVRLGDPMQADSFDCADVRLALP